MHTDIILSTERLEYLELLNHLMVCVIKIYNRNTSPFIYVCGFYMPGNATICNINNFTRHAASYLQTFWNECDCPLPHNVPES